MTKGSRVTRRAWAQSVAIAIAGTTGCAVRRAQVPPPSPLLSLPRVHIAENRIIRTVAGLRPFRPSGFVVRTEKVGEKIVVHNYGHGGGGMTLSWGTAHLAVDQALATGQRQFAVLGCGGVGLATARLLQRKGAEVTIYAKDLPPETTSNISGAQWWPVSVFDRDRLTPQFQEQFVQAARLSYRHYQTLPGDTYGIRWVSNYILSDHPLQDSFLLGKDSPLAGLYPEFRDYAPGQHRLPLPYVRRFDSMMIEPPVYLTAMLRDVQISGARIVVGEIADRSALQQLPQPVVLNCTGLGARKLFGDEELMPVKGQLTVLLPQPEIQYNLLNNGLYMFPRRDGILLGGTFVRGDWSLEPDQEAAKRILAQHTEMFSRF